MSTRVGDFLKKYEHEIVLLAGVFLVSLISFAAGYLYAAQTLKEPIEFEYNNVRHIEGE